MHTPHLLDSMMSSIGLKRPLSDEDSSAVWNVKKSSVPEYLRVGAFYLSLGEDEGTDDQFFEVPKDAMKPDKSVSNSDELEHLLRSLRFWGVDGIVPEVVDLVFSDTSMEGLQASIAAFEQDFPFLITLNMILMDPGDTDTTTPKLIVASGNLDLVKYHHTKFGCVDTDGELTAEAARHGHLDCLRFLHENNYPLHANMVEAVMEGGNMDCLRYLHEQDPMCFQPSDSYGPVCRLQITSKNLEAFLYCIRHGACFTHSLIASAFLHNGLESARYCVEQKVPLQEAVMGAAIWAGRLDCVQYFHAQGCGFPDDATNDAAMRGHLDILKYLYHHGAGWTTETTKIASTLRRLEILKYLHEAGCPWDHTAYSKNEANRECNEYLEQHGCSREPVSGSAAGTGTRLLVPRLQKVPK